MSQGITAQQLMVEVGADTSEADRKLNDLGDKGGGARWAGSLAKVGVAAFAAVGTAAAGAIGYGLKIAADNEQAQISFTTMLGSAQKAGAFLNDLKAFAAKTPFDFPGLQKAASSLVSAGFEANQVIPIMTTLGNVTSGMGTGAEGVQRATIALQQMSAAGKITGEDLNQLRDAGIPVFDLLAGATGKSKDEIAAMAQQGKLGKVEMQQLFDALEHGGKGLERFNGLMEKQSQSLTGLISTVKDTAGQALATVAEPLVKGLKDALPGLTKVLDQVFKTVGPALSGAIGGLLKVFGALLPAVSPILTVIGGALAKAFNSLAPVIAKAGPDLGKLAEAFGKILQAVLPVLPQLLAVAIKLLPPITVLAGLLASLLNAIPVPVLTGIVIALTLMFSEFAAGVVVVALITAAVKFLVEHIGALGGIVNVVTGAWSAFAGFFSDLWGHVQEIFTAGIGWVVDHASTLGRVVLFAMTGGMSELVLFVARHWSQIVSGVTGFIGKVVDLATGLPGKILSALGNLGDLLLDAGKDIIRGLLRGIGSMFGAVKNKLGDLTSKLTSWKGPPNVDRRLLFGSGRLIIGGFVAGLESAYGDVHASLAGLTGALAIGTDAPLVTAAQTAGATGLTLTAAAAAPTSGTAARAIAAAAAAAQPMIYVAGSLWSVHDLADELRPILIRTGVDVGGALFSDPTNT